MLIKAFETQEGDGIEYDEEYGPEQKLSVSEYDEENDECIMSITMGYKSSEERDKQFDEIDANHPILKMFN
jgi:hypothetical protein